MAIRDHGDHILNLCLIFPPAKGHTLKMAFNLQEACLLQVRLEDAKHTKPLDEGGRDARARKLELMLHAYQFSAIWRADVNGVDGLGDGIKAVFRHEDSPADLDVWEGHKELLTGIQAGWSSKTDLLTIEVGDHPPSPLYLLAVIDLQVGAHLYPLP